MRKYTSIYSAFQLSIWTLLSAIRNTCSQAVSSISLDYTRTNPKLGQIIPPYNGQKDPRASFYFKLRGVQHTLRVTGQVHRVLLSQCKYRQTDHSDQCSSDMRVYEYEYVGVQKPPGDSIEGKVHDRFHDSGTGYRYIALRNVHGSGWLQC